MSEKKPPPLSFLRVCRQFHADIGLMCPTIEDMAAFGLGRVEKSERTSLADFLDDLLAGDYTTEELVELWNSSGADVFIPDTENLITLFKAMRQELRAN